MATIDTLTAAHLSSPSPSSLTAVADHVIRGDHAALQQLVGALGPQLTSTDERERSQATLLLADVLSRMALSELPADSVAHLADFFCNRLTDYPCAAAVMRGLLALLSSPLQAEHALRIGTTLLEECDVRSLVQAERHAALTLANELVRAHWAALSSSGVRMLLSALRALDGEKDPRNLLLYLQLLRTLCQRCEEQRAPGFDVTANQLETDAVHSSMQSRAPQAATLCEQVAAEEVFEALALYFPIAFTPPPNDPHRITEQHLLQALLRTLRASRFFGPPALTFFGSKLHAAEEQPTKMQARATFASHTPFDPLPSPRTSPPLAPHLAPPRTSPSPAQALQAIAVLAPTFDAATLAAHAQRLGAALGAEVASLASPPPLAAALGLAGPDASEAALRDAIAACLAALATAAAAADRAAAGRAAAAADGDVAASPPPPLLPTLVTDAVSACVAPSPRGPGAEVTAPLLGLHPCVARGGNPVS